MGLSNIKRYKLMIWVFFISLSLFVNLADSIGEEYSSDLLGGPQPVISDELPLKIQAVSEVGEIEKQEVVARLLRIKNLDVDEAKKRIKELLSEDKEIGAIVEVLTVMRFGEEIKFMLVKDTPRKIEKISQILEEWEEEFAPVTVDFNFNNVPLNQILATIAQSADLNIVGGEELSQEVSAHLKDVSLDDAFDTILKSVGYTYVREGRVLRIIPEKEAFLVTEVIDIQFVPTAEIEEAVSHLVTEKGSVKSFSKFSDAKYTTSLIITDTPESLEVIKEVIKKLDKRLRQVMIEVKFAEVTLDKDLELGIDWVAQASITGAEGPTVLPFEKEGEGLIAPPTDLTTTSGSITVGTMSFSSFTATLKALDTDTTVNLIASPRIATRDGEEAEIVIGDKIPIPIYERHETTGVMEVTGYQEEDTGVLLRVRPIINKDNTVTLYIHPEVSEQSGSTGPSGERPIISTREISTVFTVADGKTIVLGGLMKQTLTKTIRKIPFLGDIPLFGNLFKYKIDRKDRKDLLIFITPHILDEPVQGERLISKK